MGKDNINHVRQDNHDGHANYNEVLHIRTTIPLAWAAQLDHVLADLRISKLEALRESVGLFLRFHGYGKGIPEPLTPKMKDEDNGR
jgi:hypothetical protein